MFSYLHYCLTLCWEYSPSQPDEINQFKANQLKEEVAVSQFADMTVYPKSHKETITLTNPNTNTNSKIIQ